MEKKLTLRLVTALRLEAELECRSIRLPVSDDAKGKRGGSYGIRPGHLRAILALAPGKVTALTPEVHEFDIGGGFATVDGDVVTVLAD